MSMPYADACTCRHSEYCNHECHGRHCDPSEHICSLEFLPDEGGLTPWGCADCTPGDRLPHLGGCPTIVAAGRSVGGDAPTQPSAPFS